MDSGKFGDDIYGATGKFGQAAPLRNRRIVAACIECGYVADVDAVGLAVEISGTKGFFLNGGFEGLSQVFVFAHIKQLKKLFPVALVFFEGIDDPD